VNRVARRKFAVVSGGAQGFVRAFTERFIVSGVKVANRAKAGGGQA
jgi:hypothetical protein